MPCLRFFIGVFIVVIFSHWLVAEEVTLPPKAGTVPEPLRMVTEQIIDIFTGEEVNEKRFGYENFANNARLREMLLFLKESENLFVETEPNVRDEYYGVLIDYQMIALRRGYSFPVLIEDVLHTIDKISDEEERKEYQKMVREFGFEPYESIVYGRGWLTVDDALEIKYPKLRNYALNSLFHRFLRQNPPNFDEAFRAADAIDDSTYGKYPHDSRISQERCYSLIAIKQLLMKQTDEAEKTLQLITKSPYQTRLLFVLIYDEQGNTAAAERHLDAAPLASSYYDVLVQLKSTALTRRMVYDLVTWYENIKKNDSFEWPENYLYAIKRVQILAKALLFIGDREAGLRYIPELRELIAAMDEKVGYIEIRNRARLIDVLIEFGLQDEADKEMADLVEAINAGKQVEPFPKPELLRDFSRGLLYEDRFAEAIQIARLISWRGSQRWENLRFEAYDEIAGKVIAYMSAPPNTEPTLSPRKRFSTVQEALDIAEMLTDEPGGKSLESYRTRIRRLAERMP